MNNELDFATASREVLLAIIADQQAIMGEQQVTIAQLEQKIAVLEARVSGGGSTPMHRGQ